VQTDVAFLHEAALVSKRRVGRERLVAANPATIREASQLLAGLELVWRERLDRFGAALADEGDRGDRDGGK
jgi:hypothetical protein